MTVKADIENGAGEDVSAGARIGNVRWTICAMLFAATSINYMDRQVISILKPMLEHNIGLTEVGYGYIVDAVQIAYALGFLAAGRFVDKVGTRIGYVAVMAVWSLAAMGHALANTALEFGIARAFLGIGQSGNFPAAIKTVAEWFPQSERSLATGIFNSGTNFGAILAPLIVPWVALHYGWHAAFLFTGIFSALWILLWLFKFGKPLHKNTAVQQNQEASAQAPPSIPWRRLLGFRQTWAFAIGKFLTDPIWWFYLFWLPSFFSTRYHLDLSHLGMPLVIVYIGSAVGSVGGGWLPAPFRKLGFSATKARLGAMLLCAFLVVPIFMVNYLQSEWASIALLSLAAAAHQGWAANLFTTTSDMFPRSAIGSVTGIGGMAGSVGGALLATSAGYILQFTHSYSSLFVIAASAYLLAFVMISVLAPGLKRVNFAG